MGELAKLAQSYRAGEAAGGALPNGADLRFRGMEGTLPDLLASLRYDDMQMAARFLAMFTKLGTTETGSRALGSPPCRPAGRLHQAGGGPGTEESVQPQDQQFVYAENLTKLSGRSPQRPAAAGPRQAGPSCSPERWRTAPTLLHVRLFDTHQVGRTEHCANHPALSASA
jgi:hypothetical protein